MQCKRWSAVLLLLTCGLAAGSASAGDPARWDWKVPEQESVTFQGVVNLDGAGAGTYGMLYPAPNAIGFLAAVLTHAAVAESAKDKQKAALQKSADKVLDPFQPALVGLTNRQLMEQALSLAPDVPVRLQPGGEAASAGERIDSVFAVAMTQDRRALVLDHAVALYAAGAVEPSYRATVRVVSAPLPEGDEVAYWNGEGGTRLRKESAALLAESLRVAIAEHARAGAENTSPQKTYRYPEGGREKIERAQLVSEVCGRRVLKNLRGWLLSVPLAAGTDETCRTASAPSGPPAAQ